MSYEKYTLSGAVSISIAAGQNVRPRPRQPVGVFGGVVYSFGGVVHVAFHWVSSQSIHGSLYIVADLSNLLLDRPSIDHPFQFQSNGQIYTCCPELRILSCPNVRSITVREQLNSLLILQILNCPNLISFEGIESAVNLECLVISLCGMENLPNGLPYCTALQRLIIRDCSNLRGISGLPSSLQKLYISNCPNLIRISEEKLHSVIHLQIQNCLGLECFGIIQGAVNLELLLISSCGVRVLSNGIPYCKFLQDLWIWDCPNLISIPDLGLALNSLTGIRIKNCPNLTYFGSLQGASELKRLVISSCGVKHLPIGLKSCQKLEDLMIWDCPNLESIPNLRGLLKLSNLVIRRCGGLRSVGLSESLLTLKIGPFCEELESFPRLPLSFYLSVSLEKLAVYGWAKLKSLPAKIQHFHDLEILHINGFGGMEALPDWLGSLPTLESLSVANCWNLKSLPAIISLAKLKITDCPILQERLTEVGSNQRHNIAHIPTIILDGRIITVGEFQDVECEDKIMDEDEEEFFDEDDEEFFDEDEYGFFDEMMDEGEEEVLDEDG